MFEAFILCLPLPHSLFLRIPPSHRNHTCTSTSKQQRIKHNYTFIILQSTLPEDLATNRRSEHRAQAADKIDEAIHAGVGVKTENLCYSLWYGYACQQSDFSSLRGRGDLKSWTKHEPKQGGRKHTVGNKAL